MKPVIVFLEPKGTALEVVRTAKSRGFDTVAFTCDIDFLQASAVGSYQTGFEAIDEIVQVPSWNSSQALQECITRLSQSDVKGVFSAVDPCAITAANLQKYFGLPYTEPENLEIILNKSKLRAHLREHDLSQLLSYSPSEIEEWDSWLLRGSGYFKPVKGLASAYVRECKSLKEFYSARSEFLSKDHADPKIIRDYTHGQEDFVLEEAFTGELLSVEGIMNRGTFRALGLLSRILLSSNAVVEMGSCFPYKHPREKEIIAFVEKVHSALGFFHGATHVELMVSADGRMEIIDFNPRFVGADVLQSINFAFGVRFENSLLDLALGVPFSLPESSKQTSCLQYVLSPPIDCFHSMTFPNSESIKFQSIFLEPGRRVSQSLRQLDYAGCYLTVGESTQDALTKSANFRKDVLINGTLKGIY